MGKPTFFKIADCESEARRIHLIYYQIGVSFRAVDSKACHIHSDFVCGDLAIAACISFASAFRRRATIKDFGLVSFFVPVDTHVIRVPRMEGHMRSMKMGTVENGHFDQTLTFAQERFRTD
jgi:hypothetical protein